MGGACDPGGQRGARVTTLTLSPEQCGWPASWRLTGLWGFGGVRVQDYRVAGGRYAVVSVEMIEAVGEAYWPAYFAALDRLLAPGGRAGIRQSPWTTSVSSPPGAASAGSRSTFSRRHHPVSQAVDDALGPGNTLRVTRQRELRPHYARTLRLWRERFLGQWPRIHAQGFDETFRRMWEFYLAYSEAGFRSGYLGVSRASR